VFLRQKRSPNGIFSSQPPTAIPVSWSVLERRHLTQFAFCLRNAFDWDARDLAHFLNARSRSSDQKKRKTATERQILTIAQMTGKVSGSGTYKREMTVASLKAVTVLPLTLFFILSGCSGTCSPPNTSPASGTIAFTSGQFNLVPGQSWDMKDTVSGDLTHFETLAVDHAGCQPGRLLDMHITKQNAQDYWQAGLPGAEVHWIMEQDSMTGDWRAAVSLIGYSDPLGPPHTVDYLWLDSNAYLVVPGVAFSNPQERVGWARFLHSTSLAQTFSL
jgi:hypothetical protein